MSDNGTTDLIVGVLVGVHPEPDIVGVHPESDSVGVHPEPDSEVLKWTSSEWAPDHPLLAPKSAVTPRAALNYAPIWQAVSLISGDIAKLPLSVRRRTDSSCVNRQANFQMSAFEFWRWRMLSQLLNWATTTNPSGDS